MRAARAVLVLGVLALAAPAHAAPAEALHELRWFVHVDLLAPMGRTLAFYEDLLARRSAEAALVLKGHQGPFDTPCCAGLDVATVTPFGEPGDGLDVINTDAELAELRALRPGAVLVRSVFCCDCNGSPNTSIIGCAETPGEFLIVSLDAEDEGFLHATIAHERGHNTGLRHVSDNPCRLMAPFAGGSCLDLSECNTYRSDATTSGEICECLGDAVGDPPLADGSACTDASGCGLCSGGVCGACGSAAAVRLVGGGGPGSAESARTDQALVQSAVTGGWTQPGPVGSNFAVRGAAYASRRDTVYAVAPSAAGDVLITLDPETGMQSSFVSFLGRSDLTALAYDPGPEPAPGGALRDRLLAVRVDNELFGELFDCPDAQPCFSQLLSIRLEPLEVIALGEVDPSDLRVGGGITGLAYDPGTERLFASSALGVHRIETPCPLGVCPATLVDETPLVPSALALDAARGRLLRVGGDDDATLFEELDPATGRVGPAISLDPFTPGGLAATPVSVPEPEAIGLGLVAAVLGGLTGRRRRPAPR